MERALKLLREGRVRPLLEGYYLVFSSEEGKAYLVGPGGCGCPGFQHRGECKHLLAVELLGVKEAKAA